MLIKNKVFRNAGWIIICRVAQSVFSLIVTMLTARYLGPSNFGVINYASSIVAFVVPIMQLGLNNTLVREFVNDPENEGEIMGSAVMMSFCSAVLNVFFVIAFTFIVNAGEFETIVVCALYSILLLFQCFELFQYWFQSKYLSKYTSLTVFFAYAVVSVYKIYLLASGKSVYWFAVSNAIDYFLIAIALSILYKRLGGKKLKFSFKMAKKLFSNSRHYIVSGLMVTIFSQTDRIMLKNMVSDAATGYYSAAVTCAGLTSFVFAAIIDSARPSIFEARKDSVEKFEKRLTQLYSIILYLSLLQCIGITVLSKPIIQILYGAQYAPAISALRVIVWYTTFSYFGSVRNIWMLGEDKQKYLWIINLFGALGNVILNLILIPRFDIIGAAAASLITQILTNVVLTFIMKPIRKSNILMLRGFDFRCLLELVGKKKH